MQTFIDSIPLAKEKLLETLAEDHFLAYPSLSSSSEGEPKNASDEFEENSLYSENPSDNL